MGKPGREPMRTQPPQRLPHRLDVRPTPQTESTPHAGTTRLWVVVHLPRLSLDALGVLPEQAAVLSTTAGRHERVVAVSEAAGAMGIQAGWSLSMAISLGGEGLHCLVADPEADQALLTKLADWAWQFSPTVSVLPQGVGLEVAASLKLFGGINTLLARLKAGLHAFGVRATTAAAPTLSAAAVLARLGHEAPILQLSQLRTVLRGLPVNVLGLPVATDRLQGIGVRVLADLLRLPRAGWAERLSPELPLWLDQLLGQRAELPRLHRLSEHYHRAVDFLHEVTTSSGLNLYSERLLQGLCAWLRARGLGLLKAEWQIVHAQGVCTRHALGFVVPTQAQKALMAVQRELWDHTALAAPARGLRLKVIQTAAYQPHHEQLLPTAGVAEQEAGQLFAVLSARLGGRHTRHLQRVADYRPERAWESLGVKAMQQRIALRRTAPSTKRPLRPLGLLEQPILLESRAGKLYYHAPLELLHGPERIESGWWDGEDIARDYYIAQTADGLCYWVYQDLRNQQDWYIHGIFS